MRNQVLQFFVILVAIFGALAEDEKRGPGNPGTALRDQHSLQRVPVKGLQVMERNGKLRFCRTWDIKKCLKKCKLCSDRWYCKNCCKRWCKVFPGDYCKKGQSCWPTDKEIKRFKQSIKGEKRSCLMLPRFLTKEAKHKYEQKCLDYTGLYINKNCPNVNPYTQGAYYNSKGKACMTPYQFLTNRNYKKIKWMPAFIVTAETPHHISKAVRFANKHKLSVSVMSTGHDAQDRNAGPGKNSLLIRTTCFTNFEAFPNKHIESALPGKWKEGYARVGAGLTFGQNYWEDLNNSEGLYELAKKVDREIVGGTCNSVGIVGWMLGGGRGWTSPKYGLGSDQLLQVDMVLANGKSITANFREHSDIFYAIRGGGGGFGVIYSIKIKLHKSHCGSDWTNCYTAKELNITGKYSHTSRNIVEKVTRMYMEWSLNYAANKWNSVLRFNYNDITNNYTILIQANCLEKTSDTTCYEFDDLINKTSKFIDNEEMKPYIETGSQTKDNYWTSYGTDTGEKSVNRRWEQQLRSLVNSSGATNGFIETILDYWQPMCEDGKPCISGFYIGANLPALCSTDISIPGCQHPYYTSVYNSGGSIPTVSRQTSFVVFNYNVVHNKIDMTLDQKEGWLHKTLAPALYKYSSKSYFNEAEYTLDEGDWKKRFWGDDIYKYLLGVKDKYDPNYTFGCRHCVGC